MLNGKKILVVFLFTVWLNPPSIHCVIEFVIENEYIQLSGETGQLNYLSEIFENLHKGRKACILIVEFQLILFIYCYVPLKSGRTFAKESYSHLWGWDSGEIFSFPVFYNGRLTVSPCYLYNQEGNQDENKVLYDRILQHWIVGISLSS